MADDKSKDDDLLDESHDPRARIHALQRQLEALEQSTESRDLGGHWVHAVGRDILVADDPLAKHPTLQAAPPRPSEPTQLGEALQTGGPAPGVASNGVPFLEELTAELGGLTSGVGMAGAAVTGAGLGDAAARGALGSEAVQQNHNVDGHVELPPHE